MKQKKIEKLDLRHDHISQITKNMLCSKINTLIEVVEAQGKEIESMKKMIDILFETVDLFPPVEGLSDKKHQTGEQREELVDLIYMTEAPNISYKELRKRQEEAEILADIILSRWKLVEKTT